MIIALHGQYATGRMLERDMGSPDWVDFYYQPKRMNYHSLSEWVGDLIWQSREPVVLIGYSLGGSLIANLSHDFTDGIKGAVLYEAPLLDSEPTGEFPVLWIENMYASTPTREDEMADSCAAWEKGRETQVLFGEGRHIRWVWGWPMWGHAWDRKLNPLIVDWIGVL